MSYLFIFLCNTFPTVNSKMLNEFSYFDKTNKIANKLFLYNLLFFFSATLFPIVL